MGTSFGHKFSERNGTCRQSQEKEESPIFLQFIECVWQMWIQFRHAFEFNELFLIKILDGFYSNQYGTFLYSSDKERQSHNVREKTKSIWTDLFFDEEERRGLLNPLFNRSFSKSKGALLPSVSTRAMKLWRIYYFRHNPLYCPRVDVRSLNLQLLATVEALRQTEIQRKFQQQQMKASAQSHQGQQSQQSQPPSGSLSSIQHQQSKISSEQQHPTVTNARSFVCPVDNHRNVSRE